MIKSSEFDEVYPSDEDIKDIPKHPNFDFDAEIDAVAKELREEEIKRNIFLDKYLKGNLPPFKERPLDPKKKHRIYTFEIRRTKRDETIIFKTVAFSSELAIDNIQSMFNRDATELLYLAPISVSKEMYPKQIKEVLK